MIENCIHMLKKWWLGKRWYLTDCVSVTKPQTLIQDLCPSPLQNLQSGPRRLGPIEDSARGSDTDYWINVFGFLTDSINLFIILSSLADGGGILALILSLTISPSALTATRSLTASMTWTWPCWSFLNSGESYCPSQGGSPQAVAPSTGQSYCGGQQWPLSLQSSYCNDSLEPSIWGTFVSTFL